jgi:hypothetical protein
MQGINGKYLTPMKVLGEPKGAYIAKREDAPHEEWLILRYARKGLVFIVPQGSWWDIPERYRIKGWSMT